MKTIVLRCSDPYAEVELRELDLREQGPMTVNKVLDVLARDRATTAKKVDTIVISPDQDSVLVEEYKIAVARPYTQTMDGHLLWGVTVSVRTGGKV